jgi:hypothetical protein
MEEILAPRKNERKKKDKKKGSNGFKIPFPSVS